MAIKFEWDPRKARSNVRKHGIDFDEATTVFADLLSITIPDPDHAEDEERWAEEAETIRIISVPKADRLERRKYEEGDS